MIADENNFLWIFGGNGPDSAITSIIFKWKLFNGHGFKSMYFWKRMILFSSFFGM